MAQVGANQSKLLERLQVRTGRGLRNILHDEYRAENAGKPILRASLQTLICRMTQRRCARSAVKRLQSPLRLRSNSVTVHSI